SSKLIITQGVMYPIVEYLVNYFKTKIPIYKINAIFPLNEIEIKSILEKYRYIYFIEELESYLENEFLAIIGRYNIPVKVFGKNELTIPEENRLTPDALIKAMEKIFSDPNNQSIFIKEKLDQKPFEEFFDRKDLLLPRTLPRLCEGCPHRGAFYSIKKAINSDFIIPSDIGCYALGQVPPIQIGDFWLCMGGGIGTALGFSITNNKPVVAIIGDGTFFHAGIPPLIDAVIYNHNITVAILNNSLTAMTGGQPTPTSPSRIAADQNQIDIEQVVKGLGVKFVKSVRVENLQANIKVFKEAIAHNGPAVVIFNGECIIELLRKKPMLGKTPFIDQKKCNKCGNCFIDFSCPSIIKGKDGFVIDANTCRACLICADVCPQKAIKK
ncbi:MAG: thiamine pyrophosphate-dependent enzyme, partial [Candidatus Thorarchaeota archaeon]